MKNQNDLIVMIVAIVLGLGFSLAFFFTKRDPVSPAAPQQVVVSPLTLPSADPVMANGLAGGGSSAGGGGGAPSFGGPGGPPGMPGRPGMPGGPGGPMGRGKFGAGGM